MSSRCSAPETPAPHCASCQQKAEKLAYNLLLVWPTARLLPFVLGNPYSFQGSCPHARSRPSVDKHPHPPTTSLFSQILRPQLASSFHIHSQSRIHSRPSRPLPPTSCDTSWNASPQQLPVRPTWSLPCYLTLFRARVREHTCFIRTGKGPMFTTESPS